MRDVRQLMEEGAGVGDVRQPMVVVEMVESRWQTCGG